MPEKKTFHGPVYQQLLSANDIIEEKKRKKIDTLLHTWDPVVKEECITYFIGRKYAAWTSDKKIAFKLTADGKAAYVAWSAGPDPGKDGKPKSDFM